MNYTHAKRRGIKAAAVAVAATAALGVAGPAAAELVGGPRSPELDLLTQDARRRARERKHRNTAILNQAHAEAAAARAQNATMWEAEGARNAAETRSRRAYNRMLSRTPSMKQR